MKAILAGLAHPKPSGHLRKAAEKLDGLRPVEASPRGSTSVPAGLTRARTRRNKGLVRGGNARVRRARSN
jgi:hypothetical protein